MEDIIVVDNFLNKEELDFVASSSCYEKPWDWEMQISDKPDNGAKTFLRKRLNGNEYFTSYLFNKIKKHFNYDYKLQDVYLNGQWPGRDGEFHTDANADRTVILYITPWEDPSWGGFTHFMRSPMEHVVIPPLTGRMVNFRSSLMHIGYSYQNQNCPLRITAAFKLLL